MNDITGLLTAPVMPWDALICTSSAVARTVRLLLDAEIAALRWRFGPSLTVTQPLLPIIPLGVHCDDFAFAPHEREAARAALGIAADEVVALFVGRLSFHAKAHPHAMYAGLQAAAQRTGRKLVLIQSGWFATEHIKAAFGDGAARACPDVRALFTDGKDPDRRRQSWAAADLFVSLADNIQETFGLAPIEAMAAGLPVVVTDWDGYKDTVRDGVDGFRIPTWMLPPDGEAFARGYECRHRDIRRLLRTDVPDGLGRPAGADPSVSANWSAIPRCGSGWGRRAAGGRGTCSTGWWCTGSTRPCGPRWSGSARPRSATRGSRPCLRRRLGRRRAGWIRSAASPITRPR